MIIEQELRSEISRATRGEVSLSDLYAWLMARSWNMHKDSSPAAVELAADVEALFFENLGDAELRTQLGLLLGNVVEISISIDKFVPVRRPISSANLRNVLELRLRFQA